MEFNYSNFIGKPLKNALDALDLKELDPFLIKTKDGNENFFTKKYLYNGNFYDILMSIINNITIEKKNAYLSKNPESGKIYEGEIGFIMFYI